MLSIVMRAGSFIAIIAMGYLLKKIGFFQDSDFGILSRITIRITLPCAIITSFSGKTIDPKLLLLLVLAVAAGFCYIFAGYLLGRKQGREAQAFTLLNLTGYNIGTFVIPFAQSFFGPLAVIAVSIFDTGNAIMCLGGAFSIACMVKDGTGFSLKRMLSSLGKSVPFMTYLIMLLWNMLGLKVPGFVLSVAEIGSNANAFMAMLMIGVGFKLQGDRSQYATLAKMLLVRYSLALLFALVFYYMLPFALEVRQALVILAFAPVGSAVPGFTGELKADVGLSSAFNSITMLVSIVIIVSLLLIML